MSKNTMQKEGKWTWNLKKRKKKDRNHYKITPNPINFLVAPTSRNVIKGKIFKSSYSFVLSRWDPVTVWNFVALFAVMLLF